MKKRDMATRTSSLGTRNIGLLLVGVALFAIGLFASFYKVTHDVGQPPAAVIPQIVYPYQSVGIILLVAGIVLIASGFLFQSQRVQQQKTS